MSEVSAEFIEDLDAIIDPIDPPSRPLISHPMGGGVRVILIGPLEYRADAIDASEMVVCSAVAGTKEQAILSVAKGLLDQLLNAQVRHAAEVAELETIKAKYEYLAEAVGFDR